MQSRKIDFGGISANRRIRFLLVTIVVVAALWAAAYLIGQFILEYNDLQRKKSSLEAKDALLNNKYLLLKRHNHELSIKDNELKREFTKLIDDYSHLQEKHAKLNEHVGSLETAVNATSQRLQRNDQIAITVKNVEPEEKVVNIMTIIKDGSSFGNDRGRDRNIKDLITLIESFDYPSHLITLSILFSDVEQYNQYNQYISERGSVFRKNSVYLKTLHSDIRITRKNRKLPRMQKSRRSLIARYRNYLMLQSLETENDYVFWFDADVADIPPDLLKKLIGYDKDIIVPQGRRWINEEHTNSYLYDTNTWTGTRTRPKDKQHFVSGMYVPEALMVKTLEKQNSEGEVVKVDSIGGMAVLIKADVIREGVVFPPYNVIGGEWDTDGGYDGIETEGVCYVAKRIGKECWGVPGLSVYHTFDKGAGI